MTETHLTPAELAVLSLLAEEPRHGYQIDQIIEQRGMRNWTEIGFSSIYYLLNRLEHAGLISGGHRPAAGRGPARKVYAATPAGRAALSAAVEEALSTPRNPYPPIQLGLANLPLLPPQQAAAALQRYLDRLTGQVDSLQAARTAQQPLPPHVDAMFDYSLTLLRAEQAWVQRMIQQIQTGEMPHGGEK